jgi:hypothetical protein
MSENDEKVCWLAEEAILLYIGLSWIVNIRRRCQHSEPQRAFLASKHELDKMMKLSLYIYVRGGAVDDMDDLQSQRRNYFL